MSEEQRIAEIVRRVGVIFERINTLQIAIHEINVQQGMFKSHFESEKGNLTRLMNDLNEDIKGLNETIFNRENGLILMADRVEQREKKRELERRERIAMWLMIGSIALKELLDLITKKTI